MSPDELRPALIKNGDVYIYMGHESDSQYFNRKQMADALESAMDECLKHWNDKTILYKEWRNKIKELRDFK